MRTTPVTVDCSAGLLILEDQASLARRIAAGTPVSVHVEHDGSSLRGDVKVSGAPMIRVTDPQVMFQKIIYDGLVGDRFLRNFTATYDLAAARMIFALPG